MAFAQSAPEALERVGAADSTPSIINASNSFYGTYFGVGAYTDAGAGSTQHAFLAQENVNVIAPPTASVPNAAHYLISQQSGGTANLELDSGAATSTLVSGITSLVDPLRISYNGISTSVLWDGIIAEILIWPRLLTPTEILAVKSYFATKWGI